MSQIDKVEIIRRQLIVDERGWFLKAITGYEQMLPHYTGEIYLTMGKPNQAKGGHYHIEALEWFTLIQGSAILKLEDVFTHERRIIEISLDKPVTVFVPNYVAHIIENNSNNDFILLAYTNKKYNPEDTISYSFDENGQL